MQVTHLLSFENIKNISVACDKRILWHVLKPVSEARAGKGQTSIRYARMAKTVIIQFLTKIIIGLISQIRFFKLDGINCSIRTPVIKSVSRNGIIP
ncbi:MAG: hypothetical protein EZS28_028088 [Streblomastix strix]|uniref:Uncharacterized protein n=1 Tax=Streblomastix strix TaxID=222440 RepID=A0A5J4V2V8_9EUKA|nr:MAG: hypothetical protein EZS28_028088 [Streblomastix strix]